MDLTDNNGGELNKPRVTMMAGKHPVNAVEHSIFNVVLICAACGYAFTDAAEAKNMPCNAFRKASNLSSEVSGDEK